MVEKGRLNNSNLHILLLKSNFIQTNPTSFLSSYLPASHTQAIYFSYRKYYSFQIYKKKKK